MHPLIAATIAARRAAGLSVRTTVGGRSAEQHFDTPAARDEYMARTMPRYLTDHARALQHAQRIRARRAAKTTRPEPIADEAPDWTDYAPAEGGRPGPWWTYAEG